MTPAGRQILMPFLDVGDHADDSQWLGLAIDHRRLFDALQDGWLRPLRVRTGVLIGIGAYSVERDTEAGGHPISVHVKLNAAKLPILDAAIFRGQQWVPSRMEGFESSDAALYWPGVLPTFAISELRVSTEEERARLTGLAKSVSNVELPASPVKVGMSHEEQFAPSVDPPKLSAELVVPDNEDAIHGALSMAVWGVPKIDPWMDLLTASLASDQARLPDLAARVEAPWWRCPPWAGLSDHPLPCGLQDRLWLAASEVLRSRLHKDRVGPRELAEQIADAASQHHASTDSPALYEWLESTRRILRAESTIRLDGWRDCPVGLAIQLVLTRPEPNSFKGWFKDRPELPPAVAWSAAALCGLLHGYRKLDTQFRGGTIQRELLSVHALHLSFGDRYSVDWPSVASGGPQWSKDGSEFVLSWGEREFARKHEKPRGRWFAANLEDSNVVREALAISKKLGWPCIHRGIELTDSRLKLSGPGKVVLAESSRQLDVQGNVMIDLPPSADVRETLDYGGFRRLVAVESGPLSEPPDSTIRNIQIDSLDVPGLTYVSEFLSHSEERELIRTIDRCEWKSETIKRRVQHYGWRYNYRSRKIDTSMRLGSLPDWASRIARRLVSTKLLSDLPDQVIVNEYIENQGINAHIDRVPSFADGIVMISLLESWEMVFRNPKDKRKINKILERGSAAIMKNEARYQWTHEIPRRLCEPGKVERKRRISLTFRKVLVGETPRYS